jgi:hypothetical protein
MSALLLFSFKAYIPSGLSSYLFAFSQLLNTTDLQPLSFISYNFTNF